MTRAKSARPKVCVIGDVLADTDISGRAERLSPEAPVPVVDEEVVAQRAGGAGLAATLAATDADVTLVAALADDGAGRRLTTRLSESGIEVVALPWFGATVEKIRVRAGTVPLLRLDRGGGSVGSEIDEAAVAGALAGADAVLVADYGKGVAAAPEIRAAVTTARRAGVPVAWDPHPRGTPPVAGMSLVCPNQAEATHFQPEIEAAAPLTEVIQRARLLLARWNAGAVAVTMGAQGAAVVLGDGAPLMIPVLDPMTAADTCGAGDAFAAASALALARGALVSEAVHTAVEFAARFVAAGAAAAVVPASPGSGTGPSGATSSSAGGGRGASVVATGGCFDILHPGHVQTLRAARRLGDRLVVLLNDDDSVRRRKGRLVQPVADRRAVLEAVRDVDEVVVFGEDTPVEALRHLRPDVFVKGGDYTLAELPEASVMAEWGGTVVTVPYLAGRSTTNLVAKARAHAADKEVSDARLG